MNLSEALQRVGRDRPGEATAAEMRKWLGDLDRKWTDEVIGTHFPVGEVEQRRILCPRAEELADTADRIMGIAIVNPDVYLTPVQDLSERLTEAVRIPRFDARLHKYAGVHFVDPATDESPYSELKVICSAGTEELTVDKYMVGTGADITLDEDGVIRIWWATDIQDALEDGGVAQISFMVYNSTDTYSIRIWRYSTATTQTAEGGEGTVDVLDGAITDPELLIPAPDDEAYIHWLYAKIDQRLGEIDRYNNDALMFNMAWLEAAKRFNRMYRPKGMQLRGIVYGRKGFPPAGEDPLDQRRGWR